MTDYSHLTTPELNQLIHDLSIKSRHEHDNWAGLSEDQKNSLRALGASIEAGWVKIEGTGSARSYRSRLLDELARESEALGLYTQETHARASTSL